MLSLNQSIMGWVDAIQHRLQYYSDQLKPQFRCRWIATSVLACFYAIRFYLHGGIFTTFLMVMIITTLVMNLLTSIIDPDNPERLSLPLLSDAPPPILPIKAYDELRPFVPYLPEFYFWRAVNVVLCVALCITFVPIKPIFPGEIWYIFFGAWLISTICLLSQHREIMIKYKYIPFYYGDKKRGVSNNNRNTKVNNLPLVVERGWMESTALEH